MASKGSENYTDKGSDNIAERSAQPPPSTRTLLCKLIRKRPYWIMLFCSTRIVEDWRLQVGDDSAGSDSRHLHSYQHSTGVVHCRGFVYCINCLKALCVIGVTDTPLDTALQVAVTYFKIVNLALHEHQEVYTARYSHGCTCEMLNLF